SMASPPRLGALTRALAPQLVAQVLVVAVLLAAPGLVHWADDAAPTSPAPTLSDREVEQLLEQSGGGRAP
ncbi:MAG TPA: hypothetical protein VFF43_24015, partial [Caldimonas sp.]|nr:hypothetical protein [Caldimonas sp.]